MGAVGVLSLEVQGEQPSGGLPAKLAIHLALDNKDAENQVRSEGRMKRFAAVMLLFAMTAFGQDMETCKQAIFDPNYQVPPTLQIGDASYQQTRRITFLFSKDGIDFYGADRAKTIYGATIPGENGAWIVGVFRDETARRAEIPQIMMRSANPNLANDYASGIKYAVAFLELQMDRDGEPFKTWMKCNTKTSSQLKCPIPHDVPLLSEISYYQPNQCRRPSDWGPLLRDATPRTPYQRVGYVSPAVPLPIQDDLTKAAYLMLERPSIAHQLAAAPIVRIGGSVIPPSWLYKAEPKYSEQARVAKLNGDVLVHMIVDAEGRPTNLKVLRGLGMGLDAKAIEAMQQSTFNPAMKDGKPVPFELQVEVNFQIF